MPPAGGQDGRRHSADPLEPGRGQSKRWPDLVLESDGTRTAVELELTAKGTARLRAILVGYTEATWFDAVTFLTPERSIAKRLNALIAELGIEPARALFPSLATPAIRVVAPGDMLTTP